MTKKFILFFLVVSITKTFAQQDPMYSMYMFDKMLINPGYTGSSNWFVASAKYRNQFSGLNGKPTTQTFNLHGPIQKKHIGLGLKIINDKIGVVNSLNVAADLSYHLNLAGGKLSAGLELGVFQRRIDYQKLILSVPGDNAIPLTAQSSIVPDAAWGLYYQKKQWYVGLSQYHLIGAKFNDKEPVKSKSKLYNHMYLIAGNVFTLNKFWTWEPSVLLKIQPNSKVQLDLNAMVYYQDRFGAGLQYRTGDALVTVVKFNVTESIRISYSYDMTLSQMSKYSKGSHEILVSYGIKLPPPPVQKETHPRYYF